MAFSSVRLAYDFAGRRRGFGYIQFKHASSGQQASLTGLQHNTAHRISLQPLRQNFPGGHTRQTQTQHSDSVSETACLLDVLRHVPTLQDRLTPDSKKALSATCKTCRLQFISQVQVVTIVCKQDYALIYERRWPRLSMIMLLGVGSHGSVSQPANMRIVNIHVASVGNGQAIVSLLRPLHNVATDLPCTRMAAQHLAHQMQIRWPLMYLFKMSGVEDLDGLGLEIVSQLVHGAWTGLRSLTLSRCKLKAKGFLILSQGNWPSLTFLSVSGNSLDVEGMASLAKGNWPLLTGINLSFIRTMDAIANRAIAHLSTVNWPIQSLMMLNTPISIDMAAELAALRLPKLRRLFFQNSFVTEAAVAELARANWPRLRSFSIGHNDLGVMNGVLRLDLEQVERMKLLRRIHGDSADAFLRIVSQHGLGLWPKLRWIRVSEYFIDLNKRASSR